MGAHRTAWHVIFTALLKERAPPGIDVIPEFVLSSEPQRADLLLLRREDVARQDERAKVLRGLWPRLSNDTLVEFKSATRPPRPGDWLRLLAYGAQYHVSEFARVPSASDLTLVLIVASLTPTLHAEAETMGWRLEDLGGGYWQSLGMVYPSYVVVIDEVAKTERDDLLGMFGHRTIEKQESFWWWRRHTLARPEDEQMLQNLEGYDEVLEKLLEVLPLERRLALLSPDERLEGLSPHERLEGLSPDERLEGLSPDEKILALPDDILRALSAEFVANLPEDLQAAIRKRTDR